MDYKLSNTEQPRAAAQNAPAPVAEPPRPQPSQQDVAAAQKKLSDALSKLTLQSPDQASTPPDAVGPATAASPQPQSDVAPAPRQAAAPPAPTISADDVSKMLMRASSLIREGQVASARSLLELALRSNDPSVAFALAETYDPKTLTRWRAIGIAGDADRARTLYRQTGAGWRNSAEAKDRLSDIDR